MEHGDKVPVAYSTKNALTKGIVVLKNTVCFRRDDTSPHAKPKVFLVVGTGYFQRWLLLNEHVFLTREEAVAKAEKLREAAIRAAERKIARLKKLKF